MKRYEELLRGEADVELLGVETDRLLNACTLAGLPLREISFQDDAVLRAALWADDLPRLEKIAALCRCELRVLSLRGGRESVRRFRARVPLAVMAAVCALLLSLSGLFIWDIEVVGNETLSKGEILRALADCGVSEGCFWPAADAEQLRSEMLLRCEKLAWMTMNVRGSRATVLVLERQEKPEIYAESKAADLIAARSGVVKDLSVKNGRQLVARGDLVSEGQTLVSGVMDSATGESRRVRAEGSVQAETWPERTVLFAPGVRGKERKNGCRLLVGLRFGKKKIELAANSRKELDECDKIMKEYTLGVRGLFCFPLGLSVEIYRPYRPTGEIEADFSGAEARALAALGGEIDGEIVSYEFAERDDRIVLHAHCLENIAVVKDTENP